MYPANLIIQIPGKAITLNLTDEEFNKFAQSYQMTNYDTSGVRTGDYSHDIVINEDSATSAAMGYPGIPGVVDPELRKFHPAQVMYAGGTVFSGQARVSGAEMKLGKTVQYRITFAGSMNSWANELNIKSVRSLDFSFLGYDDEYWLIDNYLNDPNDSPTRLITWPVINFGQWATAGQVDVTEFVPQIRMSAVLRAIFHSIGYQVASNWADPYVDEMWFPYMGGGLQPDRAWVSRQRLRVSDSAGNAGSYTIPSGINGAAYYIMNQDSPLPDYNPIGAYDVGTGLWTVPVSRKYKIRFWIPPDAGGTFINAGFTLGGISFAPMIAYFSDPINGTFVETEYYPFTAGDQWAIFVQGAFNAAYNFPPGGYMEVIPYPSAQYGDLINPASVLNDVTCLDMLRGLIHLSNLYMAIDATLKTIRIEPRNDWVANNGEIQRGFYRIPEPVILRINENSNPRLSFSDAQAPFRLQFKNDGYDYWLNDTVSHQAIRPIFSADFDMGLQTKDDAQVMENPIFAPAWDISDVQVWTGAPDPNPVWMRLWNSQDWETGNPYPARKPSWSPKVCYSVLNFGGFTVRLIDGTTTVFSQYVYSFITPTLNRSGVTKMTTGFADQRQDDGTFIPGRMRRFYGTELISRRLGTIAEVKAYIKTAELLKYIEQEWKFRVWWNNCNWIIQEVSNFNPNEPETQVTMLLDRGFSPDDGIYITSPDWTLHKTL